MIKISISSIKSENTAFSFNSFKGCIIPTHIPNIPLSSLIESKPQKGKEFGADRYVDYRCQPAIPFIRISDIDDNLYSFTETRDTQLVATLTKYPILKNNDILIQTASKLLGKVSVYKGANAAYNSHLRIIKFKRHTLYLVAFLNSRLGLEQFIQRGSIQGADNFSKDMLDKIKVPIPSDTDISYIENTVCKILEIEQKMRSIRHNVNTVINDYLGLNGDSYLKLFRKTIKVSVAKLRVRPWNFREHTDDFNEVIDKIVSYSKGSVLYIKENELTSGNTPKQRFLGGANKYPTHWITPTDFDDFGYIQTNQTISSPTLNKIAKPTLLIVNRTSRGHGEYVGIAGYIDGKQQAHINQGVYRFDNASPEKLIYLTALINSDIYRYIFQSLGKGSKMREIRTSDICRIPFLILSDSEEKRVVDLMKNTQQTGYLDLALQRNKLIEEIENYFSIEIFEI